MRTNSSTIWAVPSQEVKTLSLSIEECQDREQTFSSTEDQTPLLLYWDEFVEKYLRKGGSKQTIIGVHDTLVLVVNRLKILTIEQCNDANFMEEAFYAAKDEFHWSGSTFNTHRKRLNTYFSWLRKKGYIAENNIQNIEKRKEDLCEQLTLKENQVKEIRTHIWTRRQNNRFERWRNFFFFDVLLLTGARPCELESMQVKDIQKDGESYKIVIQGCKQKGRVRFYRMPSALRDTYESYNRIKQGLGRAEPYLFCSQSKRTGFGYKGITGLFKRLSKELGFRITAYSVRRFVATQLYLAGVPLKDIQQHMGHTRLSTTLRYVEHTCALTNRGTEEMGKLLT